MYTQTKAGFVPLLDSFLASSWVESTQRQCSSTKCGVHMYKDEETVLLQQYNHKRSTQLLPV